MPVTARLSLLFYERVGEQVANELVDWSNSVDMTYRSDLRELNELNFARFDAKVEQRMSALEVRLEQRMIQLEAKLEQRVTTLEAHLGERLAQLEAKLERRLGEQSRWLFLAWASLLIPIIGLWMRPR